jgi:hypothetical protein
VGEFLGEEIDLVQEEDLEGGWLVDLLGEGEGGTYD